MENSMKFPKIKWFPYDSTIPLLGIYPDKTIIQKDTCTPRFMEALFIIAEMWKQPKYPSTNKWMKKMWCTCIYTRACTHTHKHSRMLATKKNEIMAFAATGMKTEVIILSEVIQRKKNIM